MLKELNHEVVLLRQALPDDSSDETVLRFAYDTGCVLLTCNRDDFLQLADTHPQHCIVIVIRRKTRGDERAALYRLLDRAGDTGLLNNVNFA